MGRGLAALARYVLFMVVACGYTRHRVTTAPAKCSGLAALGWFGALAWRVGQLRPHQVPARPGPPLAQAKNYTARASLVRKPLQPGWLVSSYRRIRNPAKHSVPEVLSDYALTGCLLGHAPNAGHPYKSSLQNTTPQ